MIGLKAEEVRFDYIGVNSLYKDSISNEMGQYIPNEVRLRAAARVKTKEEAKLVGNEVEALYTNGPSGGGGAVCPHPPVSGAGLYPYQLFRPVWRLNE